MLPDITMLICKYRRFHETHQCLVSLADKIKYGGRVNVLICDDCSDDDSNERLRVTEVYKELGAKIITPPP